VILKTPCIPMVFLKTQRYHGVFKNATLPRRF